MAENALTNFLAQGTELINWLVSSALVLVEKLMTNPVTACFLIVGLVGLVITTFKVITHR